MSHYHHHHHHYHHYHHHHQKSGSRKLLILLSTSIISSLSFLISSIPSVLQRQVMHPTSFLGRSTSTVTSTSTSTTAIMFILLPLFFSSYIPIISAARITITIPSTSNTLPNPAALHSSTHAELTSHGPPRSALLQARTNTFRFDDDIPIGSYLLTVFSRDAAFENLRIDVVRNESSPSARDEWVTAWMTWRGNEWDNKGEVRGEGDGRDASAEVRCLGAKEYYQERNTFSALSILKNPMILIALFTLAMVVGLPYLMDNMDPETRAEFQEMQKTSRAGKTSATASSLQNMDVVSDFASWMAGKPKSSESSSGDQGKKS